MTARADRRARAGGGNGGITALVVVALLLAAGPGCAGGVVPARGTAVAETRERDAPTLLDVDVGLLPDEAGRVGGVSLKYCPMSSTAAPPSLPRRIVPESRKALPFLVSAVDDAGRALDVDADGIHTRDVAGCVRVVVDVGRLADAIDDRDLALRAGDDLVMTPDLWLWRPEPLDPAARLFLKLDQGPAFDAMVPWTTVDERGRFIVTPATWALKSDAAFGRFDTEVLEVAGARFRIARLDDGAAPAQLVPWLTASAEAVAQVIGRYPLPQVNVLVVPTHATRPIVVGFFSRGGGPTATFFVGEGGAAIDDDDLDATGRWALTHELSHPLLPPVAQQDAWLNEGLATWHQDLLARRAGLLKDDEAYWRELLRGLATGEARAKADGLSAAEASSRMHETGAYQHAYWAGVAVMLLAEVQAERAGGASLDDVVRALRRRFPRDERPRSARELLGSVAVGDDDPAADPRERAAAAALLSVWQAQKARPFPDTAAVLAALGVAGDDLGGVHLDDNAPLAAVRRAITAGKPRAPTAQTSASR